MVCLPLWTTLDGETKIAGLDIHSPLYLHSSHALDGIGALFELVEAASEAGFSFIQLCPIHDTGDNPCPYKPVSLFSFNPLHVSFHHPLLQDVSFDLSRFVHNGQYEHAAVRAAKMEALEASYRRFQPTPEFEEFCRHPGRQIHSYAVFMSLRRLVGGNWREWPRELKSGNSQAIVKHHSQLKPEIKFWLYVQWVLGIQWRELSVFAKKKNIAFIFDKPIYPMPDSVDVWANQSLFYLRSDGRPEYISGCNTPHDPFGEQVWGHAVYRFQEKPQEVINFFTETIRFLSFLGEGVRLDHALALVWKYYLYNVKNGKGVYKKALGHELLQTLYSQFPQTLFIAEDAGYIHEKLVDQPLTEEGLYGMRCVQWSGSDRYRKIDRYPYSCLAFSANHDTPILSEWWQKLAQKEKHRFEKQMNLHNNADGLTVVKKCVLDSPAALAVVTLRDVVSDERRYNVPGGNDSDFWQLVSPKRTATIDWKKMTHLLRDSRRIRSGKRASLIAYRPTLFQVVRVSPGKTVTLLLAVTQPVAKVILSTNLPCHAWSTHELALKDLDIRQVDNGQIVEVTWPVGKDAHPGMYELAATVVFQSGDVAHLCRFEKNIPIRIE